MARGRAGQARPASPRQLRVGETMRHHLAGLLARGEVRNRVVAEANVTVSEVRASADLRSATVFVAELGRDVRPEVLEGLQRAAPALGGMLARLMHLKYAPALRFRADTSFSEAERIERLLGEARRPQDGGRDGEG
jgi:ribosome-binding factor A